MGFPVLVRDLTPSEFPFLASLAASDRPVDRTIWLRVASDHFVAAQPMDADRLAAFAAAMTPALETADPETLLDIAGRLAPCRQTPSTLLARLANASPELADLILHRGAGLSETDLRDAIARDSRSAAAVARRVGLSPALIDGLSRLDHPDVLVALAANPSAPLRGATLSGLAREGRRRAEAGDRRLAQALLSRRPVEPECAILFLEAEAPERVEILLSMQRLLLGRPPSRLPLVDEAALERLETAAVGRRPGDFVAALAAALGCGDALAQRLVDDPSGEPLAVALAALGAANGMLVRVLISNDLDAGGFRRIRALTRLNAALNRGAAAAVVAALGAGACEPDRVPARSAPGRGRLAGRSGERNASPRWPNLPAPAASSG